MASNVPEILATMVRSFETVNRLVKETQGNLAGLRNDIRALADGNRGLSSVVRNFQKLADMKMGGGLLTDMKDMARYVQEMHTAQAEMARSAQQTARAYKEIADAGRRASSAQTAIRPPAARGRENTHGSLLDAGMSAGMAGDAGMGFFERSLHESFEVDHVASQLTQDNRVTPALLAAAKAKADQVTRMVPGSTMASNLELIREGMRNYGDPSEAIDSLLPFARAQMALRLQSKKNGRDGSAAGAMDALFKSIEDLGLDIDRSDPKHPHVAQEKLEAAVNLITRMTVGSQGGVDPSKLLAFVKQARAAGISMSEEGLKNYVGVMQSMTASRSGTALAGFFNQFLVGTMTKNVFDNLQKQGIYDNSATWAHGRVQDASKHLSNPDMAKTDIVTWFQNTITPTLLKQGLLNNAADGALAVSKDAGRQTTGGLLAELAVAMAQIQKQRGNLDHTSADPVQHAMDTDPETKVLAFRTAENNLLVKAGELISGPALTGMNSLTTALQAIADWASRNPNAAQDLTVTAAGLTAVAVAAGIAANVIFIGAPIVGGFRLLASALLPFGAGGAAEIALATMAGGGVGSLVGLSAAILGLGVAVYKGFTMPTTSEGEAAKDLKRSRELGSAARRDPSSPGFVPQDGFGVDGTAVGGEAHKMAYHPGQRSGDQDINIHLDGEVIYRSNQRRRDRDAQRPSTGASTPDGRQSILYPLLDAA